MKTKKIFDKSLDKELFLQTVEIGLSQLTVGVYSYNGGVPKLQISRQSRNMEGELSFGKLGRMIKEEVDAIMPLVEKARKFL